MGRGWNVTISMIVGLGGGIFAPYVSGRLVHAQGSLPSVKVVMAEKFVLVDDRGTVAGTFGFDDNGRPEITLVDARGQVIWSNKVRAQALSH